MPAKRLKERLTLFFKKYIGEEVHAVPLLSIFSGLRSQARKGKALRLLGQVRDKYRQQRAHPRYFYQLVRELMSRERRALRDPYERSDKEGLCRE